MRLIDVVLIHIEQQADHLYLHKRILFIQLKIYSNAKRQNEKYMVADKINLTAVILVAIAASLNQAFRRYQKNYVNQLLLHR